MNGTAISMPQQAVPLPQLFNPNVKDSRWLTLEVCREYTRNKCTRTDQECKFAHPPPHVEVQNGRVTCCFDSIKGKCQRKDPPCKYLHPPQHLKEQLLQNGRNNLILRNLQWQALTSGLQPVVPQPMPTVVYDTSPGSSKAAAAAAGVGSAYPSTSPLLQATTQYPANFFGPPGYIMGNPAGAAVNAAGMNPYVSSQAGLTNIIQNIDGLGMTSLPVSLSGSASQLPSAMVTTPTSVAAAQKVARADRLEVCREFQRGTCSRQPNECRYAHPPDTVAIDTADNHVTVCMDYLKGKCCRDSCRYFHPPSHLQGQLKAAQQRANAAATAAAAHSQSLSVNPVPGMVPIVKRTAMDAKGGMAMYPSAGASATYQQALAAMQMQQQQQYVPVTIAGHPPGVPRF